MKKTNILIFSLAILGFYLSQTSCNRNNYKEQIITVDSLSNATGTFLTQINSIDSTSVMSMAPLVKEDLKWISDSLSKEDLSRSSVFLSKLKSAKKLVQVFPREYSSIKNELNISLIQLDDLKSDLINSNLDKKHANKYVNDEKKALIEIETHQVNLMQRLNSLNDYAEVRKEFYLMARN